MDKAKHKQSFFEKLKISDQKRKSLTILSVIVILLIICVGAVLAFLMDKDTKSNFFTILAEYTVKYDANGGTGEMADQEISYNVGTNLTANTFTKNAYNFNNWNTKADGSGDTYTNEQSVTNIGNNTLYAQWTPIAYTIEYNLNDGTVESSNPTEYTVETENFTLNNPNKTGYTFKGWSGTDLTGEENTAVTIEKGSTGNRSYTANYTANTYEVVFNANGGEGTMQNQTLTYDQNANLTANSLTRVGYHFKEWNTKADGTGTGYSDGAQVKNLATTGTFNLYVIWEINVYQITCEDWYVNSSNTKLTKLGSATKDYEYNTTAKGLDFGSDTSDDKYYLNFKYSGNTSTTVTADTTIYRYFNIVHPYKICIVENYAVEQKGYSSDLKSKLEKWFPNNVTYNKDLTEQQLINLNNDAYIFDSKVWGLTKSSYANNLYNAGKNLITWGNDNTNLLSIIQSVAVSNTGYTANKKRSNIVTNSIGNSISEPNDDLRLITFKSGVEKWYTTTVGSTTYDVMGCATGSSNNRWIHSNLREFPGNSLYYAIVYAKS